MFSQPFVRPCPLQGIAPVMRLGAALALSVALAVCQHVAAALAGLCCGLLWLALALAGPRPPLRPLAGRLLVVNAFVLLLWLTTPWATPGLAVWHLGPLAVTGEGLRLATLVTFKANALACVFMALAATLDIPSLTQGLRGLRCPHSLVLLLVMGLRNIHVLGEEWQRLHTAARLRGFVPRTSLHAYRTLASLLALLLLRSLDRASRVREAMLLRGFAGQFAVGPTPALKTSDLAFALAVLAQMLLLLGWLEQSGLWGAA